MSVLHTYVCLWELYIWKWGSWGIFISDAKTHQTGIKTTREIMLHLKSVSILGSHTGIAVAVFILLGAVFGVAIYCMNRRKNQSR